MDSAPTRAHRRLTVDVALVPAFVPGGATQRSGTVYIVVDVIRATTTICVVFERGCRRVLVAPGIEAARQARATAAPGTLLAGEVGGLAPAGFDFGNSPPELAVADVAGRDLIFATTNGTRALRACLGGRAILAGAFRNADAVTARALSITLAANQDVGATSRRSELPRGSGAAGASGASEADIGAARPDIVVVCSGRNDLPAYDDTLCAGYLVERLAQHAERAGVNMALHEGARIARSCAAAGLASGDLVSALSVSDAARATERVGLAGDLRWCAAVDASSVVPAVSGIEARGDLIVVSTDGIAGTD